MINIKVLNKCIEDFDPWSYATIEDDDLVVYNDGFCTACIYDINKHKMTYEDKSTVHDMILTFICRKYLYSINAL